MISSLLNIGALAIVAVVAIVAVFLFALAYKNMEYQFGSIGLGLDFARANVLFN